MSSDYDSRSRNVTAVLGPTNTGKTHLAIERMLGHETGLIGLPLRLLAREVYDRIVQRVGVDKVALVTGEEKLKPENPRFWVSTVEAMPRDVDTDFLAIDEIQLAADPERGHVFTDRLLHSRGKLETLLLGAGTMREAVSDLIPSANFVSRPRLSKLTYSGEKKITRLPKRSAVVAFSASEVYAIAELIRRQLGGAAVVLGALSPRTRNAQVALYQSGDVDYLVATDAIGMGLNLDVDHVAFAAVRKFDGHSHRNLTPGELGQIAGRAGRYMNDGTFGVTGDVEAFDHDLVERLETHTFDTIKTLEWRSRELDFASLEALRESLRKTPREQRLRRARMADDVMALETVSSDRELLDLARGRHAVSALWDFCQIPDYRKISSQSHADLIATLYKYVMGPEGRIAEDWFAKQVAFADRTDGDIDTLANRIAHIRTWTFVSNRPGWLADPAHWQERTRAIEDALSDALHERLTQRFVDKRTSALMKGMRDKEELNADIGEDGAIKVEDHFVGRIKGFRFTPEALADSSIHGKASRAAAAQVVAKEMVMRARRVAAAKADAFKLTRQGRVLWREEEIGRVEPSDNPLKPAVQVVADEHLTGPDKEKVQERLNQWVGEVVGERLKPLVELQSAAEISGLARGIAFRLTEELGVLKRETVAEEIKSLDQTARSQLRKYGVRFGAFNIYFPLLLKPAASELRLALWALKSAAQNGLDLEALPETPRAGLTSTLAPAGVPEAFHRAYGFHLCGPRVVRVDILERLADLIRPLIAWRADGGAGRPRGATGEGAFTVTPEMLSILGCSSEELGGILKALGFRLDRRPVKAPPPPPSPELPAVAHRAAFGAATGWPETTPAEAAALAAQAKVEAAAAGIEPEMEEIWRPRRRSREDHRGQEGARRGGRGRNRHEGQGQRGGRPGERHGGRQQHAAAQPGEAGAAAAGEAGVQSTGEPGNVEPQQRRDRDRGHGRDRDRRGREGGGEREGGRGGTQRQGQGQGPGRDRDRRPEGRPEWRNDRPREDRRGGGGRDERRSERPLVVARSSPPRKEIDPDSPFAKLGALKQALEKQSREPGK